MTYIEFISKHNLYVNGQWGTLGSPIENIDEEWLKYHNFTKQQVIDFQNRTYGWDDRINMGKEQIEERKLYYKTLRQKSKQLKKERVNL